MKMKKLLSSIISLSLISGMFASYSVSAETTVTGKTEEIVCIVLMFPFVCFYSIALTKLRFMLEDFFKNKN